MAIPPAGSRFELAAHARVDRLKLGPTPLLTQFRALSRVAFRVLALVVALGLTNVWATFVLKQFPYTYPWGDQLDDYLLGIGSVGLAALHAVPNLIMLVVIYLVTRFVLRWIRLLFEAVQQGRLKFPGLEAETAVPAQRLVVLFVWLLALAVAFPYIPGSAAEPLSRAERSLRASWSRSDRRTS